MALVKYQTVPTFDLFDRFFGQEAFQTNGHKGFSPSVDVAETENSFELSFALPGFTKESFTIDVEERNLVVSGERSREDREGVIYHSVGTGYGKFKKSYILPDNADAENIKATFENGILRVEIAKKQKTLRKIEVK
ncbi:Hsp20/alpha crystallin family protein [Roseivirga sp. BDSF3-8]|uniref:Hsp20/alpha crystallin family protein n=1 Tax=Roseivirga sp. BDSF3-8 TaxID=3241598 RepID=UPI003531FC82